MCDRGGGEERRVVLDEQAGFVHLPDAVHRGHDPFAEDEECPGGGRGVGQLQPAGQCKGEQAADAHPERDGESEGGDDGDAEPLAGGLAQLGHVPVVQRHVPGVEIPAQAERPHLLRRVLLGEQPVQVVTGPRGAGHAHVEAEHGLAGLHDAEQQRQAGDEQQRHEPRLDGQQRDHNPADGCDRADGADQPVDQLDRPVLVGRRPDQPVVKRRGLVRRQLHRTGDVDDGLLDMAGRDLGQDLPDLPPRRGDQAEGRDDDHHADQLGGDRTDPGRLRGGAAGGQHRADQVPAEDQGHRQAKAVHQLQGDGGDQHAGRGRPHEADRVGGDPG
jgi:hypothetical protein